MKRESTGMGSAATGTGFRRFRRPRMPRGGGLRPLLLLGGGLVLIYLLVLSDFGLLTQWRLHREAVAERARIEHLRQEQARLEAEQGRLSDDAELERAAREQHGMIKPGENVYRLTNPDSARGKGGGV